MSNTGSRSQSNKISVSALRTIPYAVLVKAIISITVVLYSAMSIMGNSGVIDANDKATSITLHLSYESVHLMTLVVYFILIMTLIGMRPASRHFATALRITEITAGLFLLELLTSVLEIEAYSGGYEKVSAALFWTVFVMIIAKAIGLVLALMYVMKGFAEIQNTIGDASAWRKAEKAGKVYFAFNVVMLSLTTAAEFAVPLLMEYTIGASSFGCAVIELYMFIILRKSSYIIWMHGRKDTLE